MKNSISFKCLIIALCFIVTLTVFFADNAELSTQNEAEKGYREFEQSELRDVQTKQIMCLRAYDFLTAFECKIFRGFLSYEQHNYQPQVQSYIISAYSIHSPPIKS